MQLKVSPTVETGLDQRQSSSYDSRDQLQSASEIKQLEQALQTNVTSGRLTRCSSSQSYNLSGESGGLGRGFARSICHYEHLLQSCFDDGDGGQRRRLDFFSYLSNLDNRQTQEQHVFEALGAQEGSAPPSNRDLEGSLFDAGKVTKPLTMVRNYAKDQDFLLLLDRRGRRRNYRKRRRAAADDGQPLIAEHQDYLSNGEMMGVFLYDCREDAHQLELGNENEDKPDEIWFLADGFV